MKLKVEGHPDLVRDSRSKAIINTNRNAMIEHAEKRQVKVSIQSLSDEINEIREDFKEIKEMLKHMVSKGQ